MATIELRSEAHSAETEPASSSALVAEPVAQPLTTRDVAQQAGKSIAWVKKHAREIGGRIVDGAWQFPPEALSIAIERRTTTSEKITIGGAAPDRAHGRGVLAARAFALFAKLTALENVVVELEADPATVRALFDQWLACRRDNARYVSAPPTFTGPQFDHPPNAAWDCCDGHRLQRQMQEQEKAKR